MIVFIKYISTNDIHPNYIYKIQIRSFSFIKTNLNIILTLIICYEIYLISKFFKI